MRAGDFGILTISKRGGEDEAPEQPLIIELHASASDGHDIRGLERYPADSPAQSRKYGLNHSGRRSSY
jgi:hypothetical protein